MSRPTPGRQDTSQVLSYYFHAGDDPGLDDPSLDDPPADTRRPPRAAPSRDRRLAIVEVDAHEPATDKPRRFDRSRLALVSPPDTAPVRKTKSTSPRDVGIVGGSFAALMDQPPLASLSPLPVFQPSERATSTTPQLTPAIGESKQIGTKVAPPVMTRLGSQDASWLPPSPTKPAPPPVGPRGAPPPRPPRLHSPPPRGKLQDGSPATSFRSLASVVSPGAMLAPVQMTRGNSDYSIVAVSDSSASERATPLEERPESASPTKLPVNGSGSSHRREGAFPAHSVFKSHAQSQQGDGLPGSTLTDDRAFYLDNRRPKRVQESDNESENVQDEAQDEERTPHARKNTITSLSSFTHNTTPSSTSHYTQSSGSNYTSSNVSRKQTQDQHDVSHSGTDDMEDLIATVGTALADLGLDPADVPPATVFPPPDESKPSRPPSTDPHGARSSPMGSTVNLVQSNGSPRTSVGDYSRGSPRTSVTDIARGSPRPSVSDVARGSPRTGVVDFPRTEARGSPRPSMTEISRGSPRPSLRSDARPKSLLASSSGSPASRVREVSPEKKRLSNGGRNGNGVSERPRAREVKSSPDAQTRGPTGSRSPEKGNVPLITRSSYEQTSPGTAASTSTGSSSHTFPSPTSPPQSTTARTLPRARSSNSLARGARSSPLRNIIDQPKFRPSGAPMPDSFRFDDVLRMKTSAERAQGYVRKINQLATEDSGLGYWVGFMKGRVRPSPEGQSPASAPLSPNALHTTFGPHGPGTRRHHPQPRHVSGGSTTSEATFAVRPDAYVATNISIRAESPPLGPPPSLPYPSLARDIGVRSVPPTSPTQVVGAVVAGGLRSKAGAVGFFSSIGRKTSTSRRDRDRAVMQHARKTPARGGYAELPAAVRPVQVSAVPSIPGGPRARGTRTGRQNAEAVTGQSTGSSGGGVAPSVNLNLNLNLNPNPAVRSSVIMIGGRDSFQTMSHDGNGRPVSIRVPSSNGHGVVVPNLPPNSASPSTSVFGSSPTERERVRSPDARSSYRSVEGGSVYSGRESVRDSFRESARDSFRESVKDSFRESARERESVYGVRGSSVPGHGGNLDSLADVLPHVDRAVLAGYLERAGGHEIDAISAYLEDEKRANAIAAASGTGVRYI
ncbi:hypothetical protein FRC09_004615 [Ceratobasidium sp. 395]|nr:hypothetical protein FRC09_004615 [Ceratobasidium sp. 395]